MRIRIFIFLWTIYVGIKEYVNITIKFNVVYMWNIYKHEYFNQWI